MPNFWKFAIKTDLTPDRFGLRQYFNSYLVLSEIQANVALFVYIFCYISKIYTFENYEHSTAFYRFLIKLNYVVLVCYQKAKDVKNVTKYDKYSTQA